MAVFTDGGPFMMMVLGLGGLGLLVMLALTALGATRRRVPLSAWLLLPLAVAGLGAMGAWMGSGTALDAIGAASAEMMPALAKSGWSVAMLSDWGGRWIGAGLLMFAAWGAGLGAVLRSDGDVRTTWFAAVSSILLACVGGIVIAGYSWYYQLPVGGYLLAALLAFGGVGVGVGALRRALHDHAFRVAGMRFASGMSLIIGVSWAGKALVLGGAIELANSLATASPATYGQVLYTGVAVHDLTGQLAWIAFAFAMGIGFCAFFAELGDVVQRGTLFDVVGVLILFGVMSGVRSLETTNTSVLKVIGDLGPLSAMVVQFNFELPSAGVSLEGNTVDARPVDGGFGDVLVLGDTGWTRRFAWTGRGWTDDDTPIAEAQLHTAKKPLLVMGGDKAAGQVVEVLEKAGGEGYLLLRINNLDVANVEPEVAARQGTLLPLRLSTARKHDQELWVSADQGWLMKGPVRWYGDGSDERKFFTRTLKAFEQEAAQGVHVVTVDRARARDLPDFCLGAVMKRQESGLAPSGAFCAIAKAEAASIVEEAAAAWTPPEVQTVSVSVRAGRGLDGALPDTLLRRELGAFAWCATKAGDTKVAGRLGFDLKIKKDGVVEEIPENGRNAVTDPDVINCARERMRPLEYGPHAEEAPVAIEVVLTYR